MFGKFSCGTYVIVVLNSNIVLFLNMRNFFSAIFSMVLSNLSIFLCGVRYTPSRSSIFFSFFFCACVIYFCYKTGFDSVISCPVAVLERFTLVPNNVPVIICYAVHWRLNPSKEIISKTFIIMHMDSEILWCNHITFTLYHLLL